jgi:hypothetical protein
MGFNDVTQIVKFQWKAGGWLALTCAAIGGIILWQQVSLSQCPGGYNTDPFGNQECPTGETLDVVAVLSIGGGLIVGGCIGVGIALILLALGVRHDTLGIDEDA